MSGSRPTASRRAYHDKQWAAKMKEIGLQPSATGDAGGKETGQTMTHYIVAGGAYAKAYAKLQATGRNVADRLKQSNATF